MLPTTPNETKPIEKKPMPRPLEQLITPALSVPAEKYPLDATSALASQGCLGAAAPPPITSTSKKRSTEATVIFAQHGRSPSSPPQHRCRLAFSPSSTSAPSSTTLLSLSSCGHGPLLCCNVTEKISGTIDESAYNKHALILQYTSLSAIGILFSSILPIPSPSNYCARSAHSKS